MGLEGSTRSSDSNRRIFSFGFGASGTGVIENDLGCWTSLESQRQEYCSACYPALLASLENFLVHILLAVGFLLCFKANSAYVMNRMTTSRCGPFLRSVALVQYLPARQPSGAGRGSLQADGVVVDKIQPIRTMALPKM